MKYILSGSVIKLVEVVARSLQKHVASITYFKQRLPCFFDQMLLTFASFNCIDNVPRERFYAAVHRAWQNCGF